MWQGAVVRALCSLALPALGMPALFTGELLSLMGTNYDLEHQVQSCSSALILISWYLSLCLFDVSLLLSPSLSFLLFSPLQVFFENVLNPMSTKGSCWIIVSFGRPQKTKSPEMVSSSLVCVIHSRAESGTQLGGPASRKTNLPSGS